MRVVVITVAGDLGLTVAVVVVALGLFVGGAVAVLVDVVADLGGAGVDCRVAIVAIDGVVVAVLVDVVVLGWEAGVLVAGRQCEQCAQQQVERGRPGFHDGFLPRKLMRRSAP